MTMKLRYHAAVLGCRLDQYLVMVVIGSEADAEGLEARINSRAVKK